MQKNENRGRVRPRIFVGIAGFGNEYWATLVYNIGQIAIEWLVLFWLYRKNTFLKI